MRVFVTGATGYIGSAVVDALLAKGHEVVGLARSEAAEEKLKQAGVRVRRGELVDPNAIRGAADDSDGVIHTANTNDTNAEIADEVAISSIIAGLRASNKAFVYTSGIWVNGDTGGKIIDEHAPYNPAALVAWRPAHERRVLDAAAEGVRGIVIRPGIVYGRGGGIPRMMIDSAKNNGAVTFVGTGENHWPLIHIDDLAELYVLALEKAPARTILFGVAGDAVKLRDIAEAASAGGKMQPWPLEEARKTLGPFADALALDQQVSGSRAMQTLGWRPSRPSILDDLRHGSYSKK